VIINPVLGRMTQMDPMSDKYSSLTPYNYSFNNPILFSDRNGADPLSSWDEVWRIISVLWNTTSGSGEGGASSWSSTNGFSGAITFGSREEAESWAVAFKQQQESGGENGGRIVEGQSWTGDKWITKGNWRSARILSKLVKTYSFIPNGKGDKKSLLDETKLKQGSGVDTRNGGPDPSTSLFELFLRIATKRPNAISVGGNVEAVPGIGGGVYERGKIHVFDGKGSKSQYHDLGIALAGIDGGVNVVFTEYYYVNLSGNPYNFSIKDHIGARLSVGIDMNIYGVLSVGKGFSIAPVNGLGSNMFIISKTASFGIGIEGSPVSGNLNLGQTKLIEE
jgi:hypothetical protein